MHQQHIQQAIMKMVMDTEITTGFASNCATFTFVFECVCFIFLFLIYFPPFYIRVGVGTCFPIPFYRDF
jgi:hypothetical protein